MIKLFDKIKESIANKKEAINFNNLTKKIKQNNETAIDDYLKQNIKIADICDNYGYTILMFSIVVQKFEITKKLIENTCKINAQDCNGYSALMFAVDSKNNEIVKKLIENNASVNLTNNDGKSALLIASHNGDLDIVKTLVKNNANIEQMDCFWQTAYTIAQNQHYYKIANYLENLKHSLKM